MSLASLAGFYALGERSDAEASSTVRIDAPAPTAEPAHRVWFHAANVSQGDPKVIHSLLDIRHPLAFGEYVWDETGVPKGPLWIRVDLGRQVLSLFRGGNEIATAVIIYGVPGKPTPQGRFRVLDKQEDYHSASYDTGMPYAMFLTHDGIAIHASNVEERNATHGCIGVPIAFAQLLFAAVKVGDPVDIISSPT